MKAWLIAIGVCLLIGLGIYTLTRPDPVDVTLVPVERGTVEKTVANTRAGTIEACKRSRLSLPIGGQIGELLVAEGDYVSKGQLLVTLWNRDRRASVAEATAAVNSAVKERDSLCITARSDQREARRLESLSKQKLVSEELADLAESKAESSVARCEAAKAREEQAKAGREVAVAILEQTELRAPFDGIVAEVTGKIGEYATPSPPGVPTPPVIDLITDDCHYISAPLDEVDAAAIEVGMPVRVTLDAFRDRPFSARVTRIAPYVLDLEKQARTVEVEAEFIALSDETRMLAGYSADMEIILDKHENTLRIPSELLIDNEFVLVVGESDVLEKRSVVTGITNWKYSEIKSGLKQGEQIVSNIGSSGVIAGAPANIKSVDHDAASSGD
ncbi:MAG: efflux RND transporter periplasmic adaptor subunit [Porticoccaceae bacterium]|nr:efflux RND transporter periplasmic adaptor subunit [Pseudomonadales bacterium]MCP5172206.1 efflux RND transporter periplasmic adaptor subunit [Pseudomonadales bacterium]